MLHAPVSRNLKHAYFFTHNIRVSLIINITTISQAQVFYESPHYQPLNTVTTDYTSVYTTPTSVVGMGGPPIVEVDGKKYSIVNQMGREEHTYMSTAPHK